MIDHKDIKPWAEELLKKIIDKERDVVKRTRDKIPYTTVDGIFDDKFMADPTWWTNGFYGGILWLMYLESNEDLFREVAEAVELRLDEALYGLEEGLHHDVGFMWLLTSVANYRITGNMTSKKRGLIAANYLSSRYNIQGQYIIAWNGKDHEGWSIIDSMMNIPLLYWATEETGYDRFSYIAKAHADKTIEHVVRSDGSVAHIVIYNHETGEKIGELGGQGYCEGSSWTRGQSWALYGFVLSYLHTHEDKYLELAKRVAHYFITFVTDYDFIPPIDFRAPREPHTVDTTAGAIAASGLIELAKLVNQYERDVYLRSAVNILSALEEKYLDLSSDTDALLLEGAEAYHGKKQLSIIYGDYFFIEAISKLAGVDKNLW